MADDKAKIDWKMFEPAPADPAPPESAEPEPERAAAEHAPAAAAAKIVFHCSNGHRIVVSATMGGQRGKCSKCGVAVRIPAAGEPPPAHPAPARAERPLGESAPEPPAVEQAAHAGTQDDRLGVGAPRQPPADDAVQPSPHSAPEDMFSGLVTSGDSHVSATEFGGFSSQSAKSSLPRPEPPKGGAEGLANPTAALVAHLFQEVEHGGIVEIHIAGGSVILPGFYEPRWSVGSHGLFASRAADDTVTLTAVAWDSIQKIVVRQVDGLPDSVFEWVGPAD